MKNIWVAFSADTIAAREFLIGVLSYVNRAHAWNVRLLAGPQEITPELVHEACKAKISGIITGMGADTPGYRALISSGIPLALNNYPPCRRPPANAPIAFVYSDDIDVGRAAARHFRSKGKFRSYAFVPSEDKCRWSTLRQRGFRLELSRYGIIPATYRKARHSLDGWLKSLPKPAAILAVNDIVASWVLEGCRHERLDVPAQVAVIGIDNDELVCNNVRPSLTSVLPNHVGIARRAAAELDRIIQGKAPPSSPIFVPPIKIIERESTQSIPPAGRLIAEALAFISQHATEGIFARDVARHLGVSESLLRQRFRQTHGVSLRDEILKARFAAVRKMLRETKMSLEQIANATGFSSACWLSQSFSKMYGTSPGVWRKLKRHSAD